MTKPWETHRSAIFKLYKEDRKTLEETREIMKAERNFEASVRAYRAQFKKWNWTKYNKKRPSDADAYVTSTAPVQAPVAFPMTPNPSSEGTSGSMVQAVSSPTSLAYQPPQAPSPYAVHDGHRGSFGAALSMSATPASSLNCQRPVYNVQDQRMHRFQHDSAALAWQNHNIPAQQFQQQQQQQQRRRQQHMPFFPNIAPQPTQVQQQHQQALQVNAHSSGALARMSPISPNPIPKQSGQGAYMSLDSSHEVFYPRRPSARSFDASRHPASGFEGQDQYLVSARYPRPRPASDMAPEGARYPTQDDQIEWN